MPNISAHHRDADFRRTARQATELRGVPIKAGDKVVMYYASANRDEDVFPEPDKFIIDRPNIDQHLAFGRGPHNCPGIHLGRMQLRVALEEILSATAMFELDGPLTVSRWPEVGALSVPLRFSDGGR